ncbi:MAG: hypothetical protein PVF07_11625 [Thiogranum sp.]|jgi:hypothetical protein
MGSLSGWLKWGRLVASLLTLALLVLSFTGSADKAGQQYTEHGFQRALITFASARAINGLISVAQGTELAVQPGGFGAVFAPGEILDPINDLVEQFSEVMLFSTAVLGAQKLLIEMSGWFWFSVILAIVSLWWLVTFWRPGVAAARTRRVLLALSGILLVVRFLVPFAAVANEAVFDVFLAPGYEVANQRLEDAARDLDIGEENVAAAQAQEQSDDSLRARIESFFVSAKNTADVKARMEELKTAANNTAEEIITLIALFMIQTLLLPLVFAWLGYVAVRSLARYALAAPQTNRSGSDD